MRPTIAFQSACAASALVIAFVAARNTVRAQPSSGQQSNTTFRSSRDIISVDVVIRDGSGAVVRGLSASDFEIREDNRLQEILNFSVHEIRSDVTPLETATLLQGLQNAAQEQSQAVQGNISEAMAGRRLIALVFDISLMQSDEAQRAIESAQTYVRETMASTDLVAVVTVSSTINVLADFTSDRERVAKALSAISHTDGTGIAPPDAGTAATDEEAAAAAEESSAGTSEFDLFSNDVRLRALKTLAETLSHLEQKKAVIYFSSGMQRSDRDNQVELRAAIDAAVRAHVSFYAVDARGLQAVVPGGDARQASGRGVGMFSGRGMARQFEALSSSQDTLFSLAADTGGQTFTDINNFSDVFSRVQRDLSAYYLLAYTSTNTVKDGRYRRITVRVKGKGLRVEARNGYYAARDFAHTSRADRETQLQDQLFAAVSQTALPVMVTADWFRLADDRYYVAVALAVPGASLPVSDPTGQVSLDILGLVSDEQGRMLARFRETLRLSGETRDTLASKQVVYQSGVTLPPGRFRTKVVVRENAAGLMGSFELATGVPELKKQPLKVSSVVLSTQVEQAAKGRSDNPLVRDGVRLVPNLTHVVGNDRMLRFYYEVYDPSAKASAPRLRTNLAFYRGRVKVYETPIVERTSLDVPERRAMVFQLEVPANALAPGLYTCQVNVIDVVAGQFTFPRMLLYVRKSF